MFASRFFRPAIRTATRAFTTTTTSRTPFIARQAQSTYLRPSLSRPQLSWHSAFRRAQSRSYARRPFNYQRFQQTGQVFRQWYARPTFYYEAGGVGTAGVGFYVYNLEEVPVSGRRRFNVYSSEYEKQQGAAMYQQTMQEYRNQIMPAYTKEHKQVQRVLDRLIPHSRLAGEQWEIHVIDDEMKNAFVIPGGKVFVFRGILGVCQGDDGLAAVLGHEIAHNVAHHAAERMSQYFWVGPLGWLASFGSGVDPMIVQFVSALAFTLPGSRSQEKEADYIGLLMMAESCYDPQAALGLWERMEKEEKGSAPPQFISTHPSSHNRQGTIREWLTEAEDKRRGSDCGVTAGYVDDFRQAAEFQRW